MNSEPVEQEIEQPEQVSERDQTLAQQVDEAISAGNIPRAKALAHQIENRALWDATLDKIDAAHKAGEVPV